MALLEIRNLSVEFPTQRGLVRAVEGVDLDVEQGEVVGVVGESGSGKSVSALAVMGLLASNARLTADRLSFAGRDLRELSPRERRRLTGRDVAMIFQEPMTSLNPLFTVGFQVCEVLRGHLGLSAADARTKAVALFDEVGIPEPERRFQSALQSATRQESTIASTPPLFSSKSQRRRSRTQRVAQR